MDLYVCKTIRPLSTIILYRYYIMNNVEYVKSERNNTELNIRHIYSIADTHRSKYYMGIHSVYIMRIVYITGN